MPIVNHLLSFSKRIINEDSIRLAYVLILFLLPVDVNDLIKQIRKTELSKFFNKIPVMFGEKNKSFPFIKAFIKEYKEAK